MPANHAINDKLQGSVATYLTRGGVVKLLMTRLYMCTTDATHAADCRQKTHLTGLACLSSLTGIIIVIIITLI